MIKRKIKIIHNNLTIKSTNNYSKSISKFSISRSVTFSTWSRNSRFASFRFFCFSKFVSMTSMSSLQRLMNLLQWNSISEFAWMTRKCMRSIFYIFRNQHQWKMNLLQQRYENNDMKKKIEKYRFNKFATRSNQFVFFVFVVVNASIFCQSIFLFDSLQSIRTRRLIKTRKIQIRKIWNSIRSRNRYRFVVSLLEKSIVSSY